MHGLEAATKMLSLYTLFIMIVLIRIRTVKNKKIAEKQEFFLDLFRLIICHSEVFSEKMEFFFDDPLKLLISCCTNKIMLPLSFDANLALLGPILGKL